MNSAHMDRPNGKRPPASLHHADAKAAKRSPRHALIASINGTSDKESDGAAWGPTHVGAGAEDSVAAGSVLDPHTVADPQLCCPICHTNLSEVSLTEVGQTAHVNSCLDSMAAAAAEQVLHRPARMHGVRDEQRAEPGTLQLKSASREGAMSHEEGEIQEETEPSPPADCGLSDGDDAGDGGGAAEPEPGFGPCDDVVDLTFDEEEGMAIVVCSQGGEEQRSSNEATEQPSGSEIGLW